MPITLVFIVTMRCDLKCAHCLRDFPKERPDLPLELATRLLIEAKTFGADHVAFTGGEAHLHPQFPQLVEMAVAAGYTWHFISHGGRTEPYLPLMEKYRTQLTHVSLSIDGATAETHDKVRRREGAFARVTQAAKIYVEHGHKLHVAASLNQLNKHEMEDIAQLAIDLGASSLSFGGTIPTAWNQELALSDDERLDLYQRLLTLQAKHTLPIRGLSSLYTNGGVHFCNNTHLYELTFNPRGELSFCCDTQSYGAIVGSAHTQPLSELIKTWLGYATRLHEHRTDLLTQGAMPARFDTCAFCDYYFTEKAPILARA